MTRSLSFLFLVACAACTPKTNFPTTVDTSGRGAPPGGRPIRFGAVNAAPPSSDAGFRIVRTQEEWGGSPAPVDFAQAMVLVASAGMAPTGGYLLTVQRVSEASGEVHVEVEHRAPGPNCPVPQSPEWVGQVVAMDSVAAPVRVHVTQTQAQPCFEPPVATLECWQEGSDARGTMLHVPEGSTIVCDGSGSRTDGGRGGAPARGAWELVAAPEASQHAAGPLAEEPQAQLVLDAPGTYTVRLTIYDPQGTTATADATILAGPPQQHLSVHLAWDAVQAGASSYPATRLLVLRGTRGCYVGSPSNPAWCDAAPVSEDNPSAGSVIRLPVDRARGQYQIVVDYPEGNRPAEVVAKVAIQIDGVTVREIRDAETREPGYRWEIANVAMPAGTIE